MALFGIVLDRALSFSLLQGQFLIREKLVGLQAASSRLDMENGLQMAEGQDPRIG